MEKFFSDLFSTWFWKILGFLGLFLLAGSIIQWFGATDFFGWLNSTVGTWFSGQEAIDAALDAAGDLDGQI